MADQSSLRPEVSTVAGDSRSAMGEAIWFPGRWIGGISLILGPVLLLAGVVLRLPFHFFFPQQLEAFKVHPVRISVAYSTFVTGNVMMWPAIATLSRLIAARSPAWAVWGGTLVIFGLFARTFHAGVDHLAFQLVRVQNLETATQAVGASYGAFHVFHFLSPAIFFGWIVLALAAYRSGTIGFLRSIALALMAAVPLGVLKGSSMMSVIGTVGLCVALVPLGIQELFTGPLPSTRVALAWFLIIVGLGLIFFLLGEAG